MKPETPNASHATPHFWREMQMQTLQARQVDLSRLWPLAKRSTCSQSKIYIAADKNKIYQRVVLRGRTHTNKAVPHQQTKFVNKHFITVLSVRLI